MTELNNKFRIVSSFKELTQETNYNVLYITDDPDKAFIFYLMTLHFRTVGGAYCNYKHCNYLGGNVIVWVHKGDLPEGFVDGLYYKGYDRYEQYRSSFPFIFTPAKYSDDEVNKIISECKLSMKGYSVDINDRKSLKAKWNDVVFNITWVKGWIESLREIEQKRIEEKEAEDNTNFQTFLSKVFDNIPELNRVRASWYSERYKNEWRANLPYGDVRFYPQEHKQEDGTYPIHAASALFGDRIIKKNHRKTIIKLLQLTAKYHDNLSKLFEE